MGKRKAILQTGTSRTGSTSIQSAGRALPAIEEFMQHPGRDGTTARADEGSRQRASHRRCHGTVSLAPGGMGSSAVERSAGQAVGTELPGGVTRQAAMRRVACRTGATGIAMKPIPAMETAWP